MYLIFKYMLISKNDELYQKYHHQQEKFKTTHYN